MLLHPACCTPHSVGSGIVVCMCGCEPTWSGETMRLALISTNRYTPVRRFNCVRSAARSCVNRDDYYSQASPMCDGYSHHIIERPDVSISVLSSKAALRVAHAGDVMSLPPSGPNSVPMWTARASVEATQSDRATQSTRWWIPNNLKIPLHTLPFLR